MGYAAVGKGKVASAGAAAAAGGGGGGRSGKNRNAIKDKLRTKAFFEQNEVVERLKILYRKKIKPLEQMYKFNEFHSPCLDAAYFEAPPMVLLLGQYSVGKTTFIRYCCERPVPNDRIGPEPTTDRFTAVMYGQTEKVIPGNAAAVDATKPFRALQRFGNAFLQRFECTQLPAPLLQNIFFVDTPGVLAGEKQRIGRAYDFPDVVRWFAQRADRILLLFDAHKLDISDELKSAIEMLKGHDDKIRVVLNKADAVDNQALMRVYGALMWSLGKVVRTPEVLRVYLGSFWDQPLHEKGMGNKDLFEAEETDLLSDLRSLPRNSAVRKINELVKRARLAKVHALIMSHLRDQMPNLWGHEAAQEKLMKNLAKEFEKVQRNNHLPPGDFPHPARFREVLKNFKLKEFPALKKSMASLAFRIPCFSH